jgi:hypothetical protein
MKTLLALSTLALLLAGNATSAQAHERYDGDYWAYRHRIEASHCDAPEVLYDRYGNKVIISHGRRYVVPAEENCHRAPVVIVPERHCAPPRFEPPFVGVLRSIFRH